MLHRTLGLILGLGTATFIANPAEACSPPLPGFGQVRPANGATVPANAQIVFNGYDFAPFEAQWLDFDFFVPMRVDQLGSLGRIYLDSDVIGPGPTPPRDPLEIWLHHTGQTAIEPLQLSYRVDAEAWDQRSPVITGLPSGHWEYREAEPGLCEQGGYVVIIEMPAPYDDWGIVAYQLFESGGPTSPSRVVSTRLAPADSGAPVTLVHHTGETPGRHCYGVAAWDVAGNPLRTPNDLCLDVGLPPGPDAGIIDSGSFGDGGAFNDASVQADAGDRRLNPLASGSRGCACSAHEAGATAYPLGWWTGLVGLLGLAARRRRATPSRRS